MKGLSVTEPGHIVWQDIPVKKLNLKPNEIKVKTIYGGICGSDISVYQGKLPHAAYPVIPGHEVLGEVVETGAAAEFRIGQRVVVQPNTFCAQCEPCKAGNTNICTEKKSLGINEPGGFSNEFIIDSKYLIKVPDDLKDERAILLEPLAVAVHALKKAEIKKDTSLAVLGCGTEGLLTVQLADYLGAKVTATDINENKMREIKEQYPQITTVFPEQLEENQFDVVIEAAGVRQTVEQSIDIVKPGGTVIIIGLSGPAELQVVKMVRKEITIHGSIIYHVPDDFLDGASYLSDPSFQVEPIISEVLPVHKYQEAYDKALSGNYRKILLKF